MGCLGRRIAAGTLALSSLESPQKSVPAKFTQVKRAGSVERKEAFEYLIHKDEAPLRSGVIEIFRIVA